MKRIPVHKYFEELFGFVESVEGVRAQIEVVQG